MLDSFVPPIFFSLVVWIAIVVLNERYGILRCDRFPNTAMKWFSYIWLLLFLVLLAVLVTSSALTKPTVTQLAGAPFYTLFALHGILLLFLLGWWAATGAP